MYTLISASVLALDLTRHPSGAVVADVVDTALALEHVLEVGGPPVLDLDRAAARSRMLAVADRAPRLAHELRAVSASLAAGQLDSSALRAALVGRLPDLVALLQHELGEVRQLPRSVVDVVVDKAVAAWAGPAGADAADAADLAALQAPWTALVGELPPSPPADGDGRPLLALLEAVARVDAADWSALGGAHERLLRGLRWSELMHEASRAAVDADRTVAVARWQLSAVRATAAAGHVTLSREPGAALSVVGAVQALALRDVLDPQVADGLLGPARAAGLVPA